MGRLSVSLLGSFAAKLDGETLRFRSNRGQALLAYLVTERALGADVHRRDSLMDLLWPGLPQKSAQVNLRQTLYQLRQALPAIEGPDEAEAVSLLQADRQTVGLDSRYPIDADVQAFISSLEGPDEGWAAALDLYRGDFLADFFLPNASTFEEWAAARRAAFRRQTLEALGCLAEEAIARQDGPTAERYARRQLALDNLRESAHRQLMVALAQASERSAALAQYGEVEQLLRTELGAEPSAETQALYRQLLSGEPLVSARPTDSTTERRPRMVGASPFRGLAAFREEDAPFFFGREALIEGLAEAVGRKALVHVILGSSGSGKSSVVYAGLLPRLRADRKWLIASARPGSLPFQATAAALLHLLEPELSEADRLIETQKLGRALTQGDLSLNDIAARALEKNQDGDRLLLLLDQFEELYTLCADDELRRRFLDELLAAVESSSAQRTPPLDLVLTLRADFMGQALSHRPFADALQDASIMVGPMTAEELQEAIEKPAEKQGAAFEDGLVERILKDVGQEPGHLPLLEFALTLLWERQDDGWLTHAHYEEIGQVEGALARYADQVLAELEEGEQELARHIFVQLVRPGQGTEDTRRVAARSELSEAHWPLVRHLADCRLVVTGQDEGSHQETVEVVHEALIQRWGRLQEWMAADRAFRTWQERLRVGLQGWEASGSDEGALLRGGLLAEAGEWLEKRGEQLGAAERNYVEASVALQERRKWEREARRQRELETAQNLAETQRLRAEEQSKAAVGMRRRAFLIAGVGFIAAVLAVVAFRFGQQANQERQIAHGQANIALARELAGAAANNRAVDTELSVLLALESVAMADTREGESALHNALGRHQRSRILTGHTDIIRQVLYSPDGISLVTVSDDAVRVWEVDSAEEMFVWERDAPDEGATSAAFSPDSKQLAISTGIGELEIWDLGSGDRLRTLGSISSLRGDINPVGSIAFSRDGSLLVAGYARQLARIWDISSGEFRSLAGHAARGEYGSEFEVAVSPDGRTLVTAGADGAIRLWDLASGEEQLSLLSSGLGPPVSSSAEFLAFEGVFDPLLGTGRYVSLDLNADGTRLAAAVSDGTVSVWDLSPDIQSAIQTLTINERVSALAFSPDSKRLATIDKTGVARLWDAATGLELMVLAGHVGEGTDLAFNPDGRRLATAGKDGTVRIWDLAPGGELLTLAGEGFSSVLLSPDGERLVTAGESIVIWDSRMGAQLGSLDVKDTQQIALSPEGTHLAVAQSPSDRYYSTSIWELETARKLYQLPAIPLVTGDLEYSPDGLYLVTSEDQCVTKVWRLASRMLAYLIDSQEENQSCILDTAFSPDGKYLLTGGDDDVARVRDALSGEVVLTAQVDSDVISVVFGPEGTRIATGEADGTVTVWDIVGEDAQPFLSLRGHSGFVEDLAFNPNGTLLASAGADAVIKVWDLTVESEEDLDGGETEASRELLALAAHQDVVTGVVFTLDGKRLISASRDGTVRVYTLDLAELVALARGAVTRSLTTEECQQYLHVEVCPVGG